MLDRKSLETIYFSFVRPLLEYSDSVWGNCTEGERDKLEAIQLEAAKIGTGATRLCSVHKLYVETTWTTLRERRKIHKLCTFYKIIYGLSPAYFGNLLTQTTVANDRYVLRNSTDLRTINTRTVLYYNTFLPSAIRDWNNLPLFTKNETSFARFKQKITQHLQVPKYYYEGTRLGQILH